MNRLHNRYQSAATQTGPPCENEAQQGAVPPLATPEQRHAAFDQAFDYRGDVTIHTSDGRVIEGYVFDRRSNVPQPYVRILPADGQGRVDIPYDQIAKLLFSGRDTAAGKSWETWVKKYEEKRSSRRGCEHGTRAVRLMVVSGI